MVVVLERNHLEITVNLGATKVIGITVANRKAGFSHDRPIHNIFVTVGAESDTGWLEGVVDLDEKGFVRTGLSKSSSLRYQPGSAGGLTIGDVRKDSTKRVATAPGGGPMSSPKYTAA